MTEDKQTIKLGKIDYNGNGRKNCLVTLDIRIKEGPPTTAPYLDIDLKPLPPSVKTLSIIGNVWNPKETDIYIGGQNIDTIREFFGSDPAVMKICDIWDRWHLNDMRAGCRAQIEALREFEATDKLNTYQQSVDFLKACGLYEIPFQPDDSVSRGSAPVYKYGHAWLFEIIPDDVLDESQEAIREIQERQANRCVAIKDDYVAWLRYKRTGEITRIVVCDSDSEGAFRAYRR